MEKVVIFKTNLNARKINAMFVNAGSIPLRIQGSFARALFLHDYSNFMEYYPSPRALIKTAKENPNYDNPFYYGSGKKIWTGGSSERVAKILLINNVKFSVRYLMVPKPKEKK